MLALKPILLVGLGGATGAVMRYLCAQWIPSAKFPYGTFLVNVLGCFAIGILLAFSLNSQKISRELWLFAATGICGGFTTFSAFSLENVQMLMEGKFLLSFLYILSSLLLCMGATWLGYKLFAGY